MNSNIEYNRLVSLFDTHPQVNIFYISADGMPFFDLETASSHAQRLQDKHILEVERDDLEDFNPESFVDGLSGDNDAPVGVSDALRASYDDFYKAEGGADADTDNDGVVVPPSDILAIKQPVISDEAKAAIAEVIGGVKEFAKDAAAKIVAAVIPGAEGEADAEPGSEAGAAVEPEADSAPAAPVLTPLEVALATPEADRTPYQKGLITKSKPKTILTSQN